MSLTECSQRLSPWFCAALDRMGRAYLEAHVDLITAEAEQLLESLIGRYDESPSEQQRLRTLLRLLQEARARGASPQAVRATYVDICGSFMLDLPAWLVGIEQQIASLTEVKQTERLVAVNKMQLREALARAMDEQVEPELVAELQYQLGILFSNGIPQHSMHMLETAMNYYEAALQVYTLANSPLQYAKVQMALGDIYRCFADQEIDNQAKALQYYDRALQAHRIWKSWIDSSAVSAVIPELAYSHSV